jgi:hypothetical protein
MDKMYTVQPIREAFNTKIQQRFLFRGIYQEVPQPR